MHIEVECPVLHYRSKRKIPFSLHGRIFGINCAKHYAFSQMVFLGKEEEKKVLVLPSRAAALQS